MVEQLQGHVETPSEQEFRDAVISWRTEPERQLDNGFTAIIGRTEAEGVP